MYMVDVGGETVDPLSHLQSKKKKNQCVLSRSQQSQLSPRATTLHKSVTDNSPGRDQDERQSAVKVPGEVGRDTVQAWRIVTHGVLGADCMTVAPADSFLLTDVKMCCLSTGVYLEKV